MSKKVFIDGNSQTPIFQQIVNETERRILMGILGEGDFLTSVRDFAVQNTVNPNTVAKAYQALQAMGLVELVRGKGLKVKKLKSKIASNRREELIKERLVDLLQLSESLNISADELAEMIKNFGRKK